MIRTHGAIHISAADLAESHHHCDHPAGFSLKIGDRHDPVNVFVDVEDADDLDAIAARSATLAAEQRARTTEVAA